MEYFTAKKSFGLEDLCHVNVRSKQRFCSKISQCLQSTVRTTPINLLFSVLLAIRKQTQESKKKMVTLKENYES